MTVSAKEALARVPKARRARIEARARELIAEELTLRDLRKAHELTQERLAELLGVKQESISNIEKRSDLLLSTLRSYVEAMGGDLSLMVTFPDRPPVSVRTLANVGTKVPAPDRKPRRGKAA